MPSVLEQIRIEEGYLPESVPTSIPQIQAVSTRKLVFRRDGYKCLSCGTRHDLTLDHIIPKSFGGIREVDNGQTLCSQCNKSKGNRIRDYRYLEAQSA